MRCKISIINILQEYLQSENIRRLTHRFKQLFVKMSPFGHKQAYYITDFMSYIVFPKIIHILDISLS